MRVALSTEKFRAQNLGYLPAIPIASQIGAIS